MWVCDTEMSNFSFCQHRPSELFGVISSRARYSERLIRPTIVIALRAICSHTKTPREQYGIYTLISVGWNL